MVWRGRGSKGGLGGSTQLCPCRGIALGPSQGDKMTRWGRYDDVKLSKGLTPRCLLPLPHSPGATPSGLFQRPFLRRPYLLRDEPPTLNI